MVPAARWPLRGRPPHTEDFFALEGSITAQGLNLGLGAPLWAGYAFCTLIILPLVISRRCLSTDRSARTSCPSSEPPASEPG